MSIFPKRTAQGRTITIHVRAQLSRLGVADLRLSVTDPAGVTTIVRQEQVLLFPRPDQPDVEGDARLALGLYREPPLLLVSQLVDGYLKGRSEKFQDFYRIINRNIHFYSACSLPGNAIPGRYQVALEILSGGRQIAAESARTEHFFVDRVRRVSVEPSRTGTTAYVENESAERTPVRIVEPVDDERMTSRIMVLPGRSVVPIHISREKAFLFYAEDSEWIFVGPLASPLCVRNQTLIPVIGAEAGTMYLARDPAEEGYALSGAAKEIWDKAGGLAQRDELRTAENAAIYDELVRTGILAEVPTSAPDPTARSPGPPGSAEAPVHPTPQTTPQATPQATPQGTFRGERSAPRRARRPALRSATAGDDDHFEKVPAWDRIPMITICARQDDARVRLLEEAIAFWNTSLERIGTPWRIGPFRHSTELVPSELLERLSAGAARSELPAGALDGLVTIPGDMVIVMSDGIFTSFTRTLPHRQGVLIAIRACTSGRLRRSSTVRNLIAHELGHAVGLDHNDDPTTLMCEMPVSRWKGLPAARRHKRDGTTASQEAFLPLTDDELALLRRLYPPAGEALP
jgi:hypothetical protein